MMRISPLGTLDIVVESFRNRVIVGAGREEKIPVIEGVPCSR